MNTPIKFTTAEEAVKVIKSGDHVHLSSVASAPQCLIKAMCARGEAGELKNVHVHHLHTEGPAPYADPKFEGVFQLDSLFVGANVRKVTQSGYADYIPIFLSETQKLYRSRCGAVQRGDDSGLPAGQARLRIAGNVGRRYAGGHRMRRPCDRRGEQVRSARLRSGDDSPVEDRPVRAGRHSRSSKRSSPNRTTCENGYRHALRRS